MWCLCCIIFMTAEINLQELTEWKRLSSLIMWLSFILKKKENSAAMYMYVLMHRKIHVLFTWHTYSRGGGLLRGLYSIFVVVIVAFVVDIDVIVVSSIFLALNKPLMHCHMLFDLVLRNFFFHLFPTWYWILINIWY